MVTSKHSKKDLNYSPMTDTVYWVDGRGQKKDVSKSFMAILAMMVDTIGSFKFSTKGGMEVEVKKTKESDE